jgi:hypothetical protein
MTKHAQPALPDERDERLKHAFFSVEGQIHDLCHMASIALMLINDVTIGDETACSIELKISPAEFERIQFAVGRTSVMAKELESEFAKEFDGEPNT